MDTWKYDNAQKYSVTLSLEKEQTVTIVTMKGKDELGVYTTSTKEAAKFEIPTVWDIERKLLMRALNNRTRERNYANICLMLAEGQISEEEFEREISTNENRYVVSFRDLRPEEVRPGGPVDARRPRRRHRR